MASNSDYIFEVDEGNFQEIVIENSHRLPVLVDFWASWCAPCQMLMPVLAKLADEYAGKFLLAKVNTDEQRQLAGEYGIRSLPTVKLFRNGTVVDEFLGVQSEGAIRALLDAYADRESDRIRAQAMEAHMGGDTSAAIELLWNAITTDPGNTRAHMDLAQLLVEEGDFDNGEKVLKSLPNAKQADSDVTRLYARIKFARLAEEAPGADVLEQTLLKDPGNCEARYQLSAFKALEGDYEGAMDQLLEILRRDRSYRDDAGRKGLLSIFELLGGSGPLVNRYRALMSSALH